jgi:N-acyl-D-amino-acid deacylase
MIHLNRGVTFIGLVVVLWWPLAGSGQAHHDLIVRNARIIDGTGAAWFRGDLTVTSGIITAVGRVSVEDTATSVVDAMDNYLTPGFIDVHTHSERQLEREPVAQNFARMGVTSIITGNCGSSYLPVGDALTSVSQLVPGINFGTLVGHGTIRSRVMGNAPRDPSTTEILRMQELAKQAMEDGAFGIATGLIYTPGTWSTTEEIIEVARPVAEAGGLYVTHMRSEGMAIMDALEEAFTIGRALGMPVQISHFKVNAPKMHGGSTATLAMVNQARESGLDVTMDQYLYTASSTGIRSILPSWAIAGTTSETYTRLRDPDTKQRVISETARIRREAGRLDLSTVTITNFSADRSFNGRDIASITRDLGRGETLEDQLGVVIDIITSGGAGIVSHSMDEQDIQRIAQHPFTMFASDSGIRFFGEGVPHPRGYGNNARAIGRYARDLRLFTLEECIRKMTSFPAQRFGIKDRGILRPGMAADLVVFDLNRVNDPATFSRPHAYAEGFLEVWVNGRPLITGGELTGERAGVVLRGPGWKAPNTQISELDKAKAATGQGG